MRFTRLRLKNWRNFRSVDVVLGERVFTGKTGDRTPPFSRRTSYADNPAFNDSVDETHGMIRIFEVEFRPSAVLFQMEPVSYRVCLAEFDGEADGAEAMATGDGPTEVAS
ncbi:MAG: hypothetical protein HZB39_16955 [Planctomycetes bacterium]|nr:hypothetical protein [Planctomycetota bacterium]